MKNSTLLWSKIETISHYLRDKTEQRLWIPALILFILGVVTRLPFQRQIISGDAGNFAIAVEHFDVRLSQPQMPGMFVVFIFLGRFFNLFLHNPTTSLVMVNILASGVAAVMLYLIGTTWYNPRVGWTVALLMLSSPAIWFYGDTAFSHMTEFTWIVLIDYAAYQTGLGNRKALFSLALLLGLGGGVRPSTPFFLLPLSLVAVFLGLRTRKFNLMQVTVAVMVGLVGVAIWFIPLVIMSGGWHTYWDLVQEWLPLHTQRQDADSWTKIFDNLMIILQAFIRVVAIAIVPLFYFLIRDRAALSYAIRRDWRIQTLFLSIVPGLLFFIFVHLRRKAQVLTLMPGIIVMAGLTVVWLGDRLQKYHRHAWVLLTALIISCNGLFFLLGPIEWPTVRELRHQDQEFIERIEFIRTHFPPQTTAIFADCQNCDRIIQLHLREYQEPTLSSKVRDPSQPTILLPPHIHTLVLLDEDALHETGQDTGFQKRVLPSGRTLRYRTWTSEQQLQISKTATQLVPRPSRGAGVQRSRGAEGMGRWGDGGIGGWGE